ncbi:Proline dehydrogenase [Candidatus Anstonella stagnisolia]|nr:Proline dehydrogenase [Candidatus Anstonella stagnisolia]
MLNSKVVSTGNASFESAGRGTIQPSRSGLCEQRANGGAVFGARPGIVAVSDVRQSEARAPIAKRGKEPAGKNAHSSLLGFVASPLVLLKDGVQWVADEYCVRKSYVAGRTAQDAVDVARELQKREVSSIFNCLGEHSKAEADVEKTVEEYLELVGLASKGGIGQATLAIRPSAFGADVSREDRWEYCYENMRTVVEAAKREGYLVCIDMENLSYCDKTLEIHRRLQEKFGNVSTVLQANVKRSMQDLLAILENPALAKIGTRLVRGIYEEDESVSYKGHERIHGNYSEMMRAAFEKGPKGAHIIVGTHHEGRVLDALRLWAKHPDKTLEIQMLRGIKEDLAELLIRAGKIMGFGVSLYVPHGRHPAPYVLRRMGKSPSFAQMGVANTVSGLPKPIQAVVLHATHLIFNGVYRIVTGKKLKIEAAPGTEEEKRQLYLLLQEKGVQVPA